MLKLAEAFIFNLMYISPEQDQKIRYTLRARVRSRSLQARSPTF